MSSSGPIRMLQVWEQQEIVRNVRVCVCVCVCVCVLGGGGGGGGRERVITNQLLKAFFPDSQGSVV